MQPQFRLPSLTEIELHGQVMSVWFALSLTSLFLNKLHIREKLSWGRNGCIYKRIRIPARGYSYKRHYLSSRRFVGKRGCSCSLPSWKCIVGHRSDQYIDFTGSCKCFRLQPKNKALISSAGGDVESWTYLVHVILPTGTAELNVQALLNDNSDYDVVIGMDIINSCDFCYTNKDGKSTFSLCHPAKEKIILK